MSVMNVFGGAKATAASATSTSGVIDLYAYRFNKDFLPTLQAIETGDGTATFSWTVSNDGTNFVAPTDATTEIESAFTKTSGPGSDGIGAWPVLLDASYRYLKILITETGTTDTLSTTLHLHLPEQI